MSNNGKSNGKGEDGSGGFVGFPRREPDSGERWENEQYTEFYGPDELPVSTTLGDEKRIVADESKEGQSVRAETKSAREKSEETSGDQCVSSGLSNIVDESIEIEDQESSTFGDVSLRERLLGCWAALDYFERITAWLEDANMGKRFPSDEARRHSNDLATWSGMLEREERMLRQETQLPFDREEWLVSTNCAERHKVLDRYLTYQGLFCRSCFGPFWHKHGSGKVCETCRFCPEDSVAKWRHFFTEGYKSMKASPTEQSFEPTFWERLQVGVEKLYRATSERSWTFVGIHWFTLCMSWIGGCGGWLWLGPWGLLLGLPSLALSFVGAHSSFLYFGALLGMLGLPGVAWALAFWTFLTTCITGLVTYAFMRTVKITPKEVSQGVTDEVSRAFGVATSLVPTLSHRTLSYMRNLVGLVRDVPALAQSLVVFWRGLVFDPNKCEKEKSPVVYVWNLEGKYALRGLSTYLTCGNLAMAGYSFIRRGQNGDWVELEFEQISRAEVRTIPDLVLVETLFWEDDDAMEGFSAAEIKDAAYDVEKREMIERAKDPKLRRTPKKKSGQAIVNEQSARHALGERRRLLKKALRQRDVAREAGRVYVEAVKKKAEKPNTKRARTLKRNLDNATARLVDCLKKKQEAKSRLQKYKMEKPTPTVAEEDKHVEGVAFVPAEEDDKTAKPFYFAPPDLKDKEKEKVDFVPSEKPGEPDLVESVLTILGGVTDESEKLQGHELDAAHNLGASLRKWIHSGWALCRVHWYVAVVVAMIGLFLIAVFAYYVVQYKKRQSPQSKKEILVPQGSVLKYEVDPSDQIVKFMVDGHSFGYDPARFNALAKGHQVGEIVNVDVVFKNAGAKRIHAMVGEGETFQASNGEVRVVKAERLDRLHPLRRTDRRERRLAKAKMLAQDVQSWKTVKRRFNFGIPKVCHYQCETVTGSDRIALTPVEKVLTETFAMPTQSSQAVDVISHNLPQSEQAFKTVASLAPLGWISLKNEFCCASAKVPEGLLMPRHFTHPSFGNDNAASQLQHGESVYFHSAIGGFASQLITWEKDRVRDPGDTDDCVLMPLSKPFKHLPIIRRMVVDLPDGEYWMWVHGIDPDSQRPFQTKVRAVKKGRTFHYTMDNKSGICTALVSLDHEADIVAAIHVRGNVSTKQCTASAFTRKLAEASGYKKQIVYEGVPGVVLGPSQGF